jgi:hypothetical protein
MKKIPKLTLIKADQAKCTAFVKAWPVCTVAEVATMFGLTPRQTSNLAHWLRVNLATADPPVILAKKTTGRKPNVDFDALAEMARREAGE